MINEKIDVLDEGYIRLIDSMGSDLSIVRNARVSYDAAWRAGEDTGGDARLIKYLMTNGHNTPFESVTVQFEIMAPVFVFRQWHRHRTQSYNELSARYKELPKTNYVPARERMQAQSTDNKQMSDGLLPIEVATEIQDDMRTVDDMVYGYYQKWIGMGLSRELARTRLGFGIYSHMFATMNLHNLFNFLRERLHPHAQYEIRVYAEQMLKMAHHIAPVATEAFLETTDYELS